MPKRFRDTEFFKDPFVYSLPPNYKLFLCYILDDCNHAGIWKVNLPMASNTLSVDLVESHILETFKDKIQVLPNGYWFIPNFIKFQYGIPLKLGKPAINSAFNILKQHGLEGFFEAIIAQPLPNGSVTIKDKDKDKDKEKEKELEAEIERCYLEYPNKAVDGRSTGKSHTDKIKIKKILLTGYPLFEGIQFHKKTSNGLPKNLSTFLNHLPDLEAIDKPKLRPIPKPLDSEPAYTGPLDPEVQTALNKLKGV